jgi:FkbM family methyltransferase
MRSAKQNGKRIVRSVTHTLGLEVHRVRHDSRAASPEVAGALARIAGAAARSDSGDFAVKRTELLGLDVSFFSWNTLRLLFDEIFLSSCYAFEPRTRPPRILDAGANIGMATLWFSTEFPGARITSIEPDPATYELLQANIERNALEHATAIHAALAADPGSIALMIDPDRPGTLRMSTDALRMPGVPVTVPALRLSDLVDGPVDLLKLDVEGAEHQIMSEMASSGALADVHSIAMEYHHHIDPDVDQMSEMLALLERSGFAYHVTSGGLNGPLDLQSVLAFQDIGIFATRRRD